MAGAPKQEGVEALFRAGVNATQAITSTFAVDDWKRPACGSWDASDTARHLVGVVGCYHEWLDRAIEGHSDPPFAEREFDARNAARINELQGVDGPSAVEAFAADAHEYIARASNHWDLAFGFPAGTVTVGMHAGIAATEWHLHAWDLTSGKTRRHRPHEPADLFRAAGWAMAHAKGGVHGRLLRLVVPLVARRSPWETLLEESGRR